MCTPIYFRIIANLLQHVQIKSDIPILSDVRTTVAELVDRTHMGTEKGEVSLKIDRNGDIFHQFMFENWMEVSRQLSEIINICFSGIGGHITLKIKESSSSKTITIHFEPGI